MDIPKIERLLEQFAAPNKDLSDLLAQIDVACQRLEILESGYWYDFDHRRRRLRHPEVCEWLTNHGFSELLELPAAALEVFAASLERHLAQLNALATYDDHLPIGPAEPLAPSDDQT